MPKEAKEKKDNAMTIAIIGLVGTLIAAALGSPVLVELIKNKQATKTPASTAQTPGTKTQTPAFTNQTLIFSEDFENGKASGFSFDGGEWEIGKDKSNQVLEVDSTSLSSGTVARAIFGPSDFNNGVIEFLFRFNLFASDATASVRFRFTGNSTYSLSFLQNQVNLGYRDSQNDWYLEPFSEETSHPFRFETGIWYSMRLEARGSEFTVLIDDNRIFNAKDERLGKGSLEFTLNPGFKAMFDDVSVWELK